MESDSVIARQEWKDRNGNNELYVRVYAACNPKKPPFDGRRTQIEIRLKNDKHRLKMKYDEENYQMCMIFFDENDISYINRAGSRIVFIPFFYCGNADNNITVSYFILYNNLKYLRHIDFYCDEDGNCKLDDDLKKKLKGMPGYLKKEFINQLSKHKNVTDFHKDFVP